jgi:hypothetical protein
LTNMPPIKPKWKRLMATILLLHSIVARIGET